MVIKFYMRENCPLCDDALLILDLFKNEYEFTMEHRDIYTNDQWLERYHLTIPVIEVAGKQLHAGQINYDSIKHLLEKTAQIDC